MTRQEIGLIGGTFDPIHIGHLVIAERAMEQLHLDGVIFVPAGTPPHKLDENHTAAQHRFEMTRLAIADRPLFTLSDRDIRSDRASFTVDLLRDVNADNPDANLTFVIGGDSLRDFPTWYQPESIIRIARLAVADRPDVVIPDSVFREVRGLRDRVVQIDAPLLDISATEVRQRIVEGLSVRYLVPDEVIAYIEHHKIYEK